MTEPITRKLDELGRIVLPKETRNQLGWEEKTELEILVEGNHVVLSRHHNTCCMCGSAELADGIVLNKMHFCRACSERISEAFTNQEKATAIANGEQ